MTSTMCAAVRRGITDLVLEERPEDQGSDSHPSDGGHRRRASASHDDLSHEDRSHEEQDAANNLEALVGRAQALVASGRRHILGIVGAPGAGKSTLAEAIVRRLAPHACYVPMDGFHLANAELDRLGRRSRKGAPDTFDAAGYVALLRRLHEAREDVVYAPEFRREIEEPIAGAIPVPSDVPLVVTEGNYLLLDNGPWAAVRDLLDEAWYVESDERTRLDFLVRRHIAFGKDPGTAHAWAHGSDQRNAELVAGTRHRADLIIRIHHGVPAAAQPQQPAGRRDRTAGGPPGRYRQRRRVSLPHDPAPVRTENVRSEVYGGAMTDRDYPWEPPLAGTEAEHLVGALDRLRTTFRWKADDLDAAGLQTRIGASSLTLGGLLKHLAAMEDYTFTTKLRGEPIGAPWDATGWDGSNDWEFTSAANDTPEQLYALWDGAVERSRARLDTALAAGGLDQLVHVSWPDGRHASLRRLLCDLIEEYGRHTGHADLLREAVDGLVGEDPPAGWHARAGQSRLSS